MKHLVVFSADLHGNEVQYAKLVDFAKSISAHSLVIGGDITPKKGNIKQFIHMQRTFLSEKLPKLLLPFKKELPHSQIYLMMGNDDCACNLDVLEKYDDELFHLIHRRRLKITEDFDIVGYSFVPVTPFILKDWDKFDLSEAPPALAAEYAKIKRRNYRLHGVKSTLTGLRKFHLTESTEKEDSIQKDLNKSLFTEKPEKTVYVTHTPPNNTNLDQLYDGSHVGSMAIRLFIQKYQPYLTLHGHIHRTVALSGDFREVIDNSLSLSAGNDDFANYVPNDLSLLVFDLHNLKSAVRQIV